MAKKFIQAAIKKPGALRKTLKAKKGKDIPVAKLKKAAAGKGVSKKTEKRAELALTLRKLSRRKKK
ncbi:MAG: hypothetical protein ACE5GV_00320 [Candidatus Scalindua sp.]